jgi:hypothetical protein
VAAWLRERLRARLALPPLRYFRLGGATPREQVQYYYLSLLRRAGEYGFGRRPAQTPAEYTPTLAANLPENTPEVRPAGRERAGAPQSTSGGRRAAWGQPLRWRNKLRHGARAGC